MPRSRLTLPTPVSVAQSAPDYPFTFKDAFPMPGVVVLMGHRGEGKTAMSYWAMDRWHRLSHEQLGGAVFRAPRRLAEAFPDWVKCPYGIKGLPQNAVVIIDEAQFTAHARRSASAENLAVASLVALSRQRNQLVILIAHHTRKLDFLDVMEASRVIWKKPTEGHVMFERPELKPFTTRALRTLSKVKNSKKHAYVMDFERLRFGLIKTGRPPWWKEEMSSGMI